MEYKPYQERVIAEATELETKLNALRAFIGSESFRSVSPREQSLLMSQGAMMNGYLGVLKSRIEGWSEQNG